MRKSYILLFSLLLLFSQLVKAAHHFSKNIQIVQSLDQDLNAADSEPSGADQEKQQVEEKVQLFLDNYFIHHPFSLQLPTPLHAVHTFQLLTADQQIPEQPPKMFFS